jgi:hypothetical protein
MVICQAKRAAAVEKLLKEVLPDHKLKREANYFYAKGEPAWHERNKDKVLYVQRVVRSFTNSQLVDRSGKCPKLSSVEDEELYTEEEFYKSRETCRHDNPMLISDRELRYEVYLRFVDKFCRDQGTVMLVFAGAKAISSCAVIMELIPRRQGRSYLSFADVVPRR